MKFLRKINRNLLLSLASMLLVISVGGYFVVEAIILGEAKETLLKKERLIKNQLSENENVTNLFPIIEIQKIPRKTLSEPVFKKIFIEDELDDELEPFLEYSNQFMVDGVLYSVELRQSIFESEDLILILAFTLFLLMLLSFVVSFFVAKKMNKTIWHNFEHNLLKIEKYSFNEKSELKLNNSNISEFDRFNKVVTKLTEKLKADYSSLKEFTENASHEIQTPLSIILLNLEEILQKDLDEDTMKKVVKSINATKRLSNLNQSLILLMKIENRQFSTDIELVLNELIEQKLNDFSSLLETKNISIDLKADQSFKVIMNEQLAEILITNLLTNAINHNITSGKIEIHVYKKELKICNSGVENSLSNTTIFNRFTKGNLKSTGLGLAIVKKICDTYNLEINYSKEKMHCFTIIVNR